VTDRPNERERKRLKNGSCEREEGETLYVRPSHQLPLCLPLQVAFGFLGRQAPTTKVEEGVGERRWHTHRERGHLCLKACVSFDAFANPPPLLYVPSDLLLLCRAGILVLKALLHIWQSPLDLLPGKNPYSEWL